MVVPLVLVVVLLLSVASPATAQTRSALAWSPVGTAAGPAAGDGAAVAWEEVGGGIVVQMRGRPTIAVARPADCPAPSGLRFDFALGADRLLVRCTATWEKWRYAVVGISSGAVAYFEYDYLLFMGAGGHEPSFDQIGSHWVSGPFHGYHSDTLLRLNWRTGLMSFATLDEVPARSRPDLSTPTLGRRLCRPLRRTAWPKDDFWETHPRYRPVQVQWPWMLQATSGSARLAGPLRLHRCGSTRVRRLGRALDAVLGRRWLVWAPLSDPNTVRMRRLRDGRTIEALVPSTRQGTTYAVTDDAVSVPTGPAPGVTTGFTILRAPLPMR